MTNRGTSYALSTLSLNEFGQRRIVLLPAGAGEDGRTAPRQPRIPMKLGSILVAAACAALLAGCASPPTPDNLTTPWTPPQAARNPDTLWQDLRTQLPDLSQPQTLADLADLALQRNPASRVAWNNARAAAAQVQEAKGYFMPTLTGTLSANQQTTTATPTNFNREYTQYGPGLQLDYLIFNFGGGRKAALEAALQTVYATDFAFNQSIQNILRTVETAYYGDISAEAAVEASAASVKDAKTALEAAQTRKGAGTGTELEVLQAQAAYDKASYLLASAQGQAMNARGILAQAVGIPADMEIQLVAPTNDVADRLASAQDLRKLVDDALDQRPDIAALRATLAAKQALVLVAGSPLWPSLYLNGAASFNTYGNATSAQGYQDNDLAYGGGLSLKWTLFDGMQNLNAKRVAQAQADAAKAQLELAQLAASADVWTRYHDYETALQKLKASSAFLKSTSASYGLALDSYQAGLQSILDLLDAESQLAQARSLQIAAQFEVFTALANLAYATGTMEQDHMAEAQNVPAASTGKDEQP
jgi:outer membrane protein